MSSAHTFVDHTAEVGLHARASSLPGLFAEVGRGLSELLLRGAPAPPSDSWRLLEVHSRDREALLVDWCNELIYLAEADSFVALEFEVAELTDTHARIRARGARVVPLPGQVKAATFHGLKVTKTQRGIEAEVILDV